MIVSKEKAVRQSTGRLLCFQVHLPVVAAVGFPVGPGELRF